MMFDSHQGVSFPLDRNAEEALVQLAKGTLAFVQLSVSTIEMDLYLKKKERRCFCE